MASTGRGPSFPLAATVQTGGVNFCIFSKNAELIELLLFDSGEAVAPAQLIPLDPQEHRTYHYRHVFVPGLQPGQVYGYRAIGPVQPEHGLRFDDRRVLLDPYGHADAPIENPAIETFRQRQIKNLITLDMAVGTPMMLMGDKM